MGDSTPTDHCGDRSMSDVRSSCLSFASSFGTCFLGYGFSDTACRCIVTRLSLVRWLSRRGDNAGALWQCEVFLKTDCWNVVSFNILLQARVTRGQMNVPQACISQTLVEQIVVVFGASNHDRNRRCGAAGSQERISRTSTKMSDVRSPKRQVCTMPAFTDFVWSSTATFATLPASISSANFGLLLTSWHSPKRL